MASLMIRRHIVTWAAVGLSALAAAGCRPAGDKVDLGPATTLTLTWSGTAVGATPRGFSTAVTGGGGPVSWVVQEDPTAPDGPKVLAQTSQDATSNRFPLCIYDAVSVRDLSVVVAFQTVSGSVDQAAGLVIRYRDKDNYYVARANALENNVRFYKVEGGKRTQLAGADVRVAAGQWHTLQLSARETSFVVLLDRQRLFETADGTFQEAGKVGLWTKSDSVTRFGNLTMAGLGR